MSSGRIGRIQKLHTRHAMKSRFAATIFAFSSAIVCAHAGAFTVDVTVSALAHCVQTAPPISGNKTTFLLPPGRYVASLVSNNMSCASGNITGTCAIDAVIMQGNSGATENGTAEWGASIKKPPIVLEVPGAATVSFSAFVLDPFCGDNTGQSTLRFQSAN